MILLENKVRGVYFEEIVYHPTLTCLLSFSALTSTDEFQSQISARKPLSHVQ